MKRFYLFLGILLFAVCLCVAVYFVAAPLIAHQNIVDYSHDYQPYQTESYDGKYILEACKIEDTTGAYATFSVKLSATQDEIFFCPEKFRTVDLKSISWGDNSLDIIVISGDVGTKTFEFAEGTWKHGQLN